LNFIGKKTEAINKTNESGVVTWRNR